jgi:outer membrane protein
MKTIKTLILAAGALALVGLSAPSSARAEAYAVVDFNRIMSKSLAAQGIRAELDAKGKQFQTELSKENTALKDARQKLEQEKDKLSQDELQKRARDLEAKFIAAERLLQTRKTTLNVAGGGAFRKLREDAVEIIAQLTKEKGYTAVFSQEAVVLASKDLDITEEVIKRMNSSVKKISVDWSQAAQPRK